MTRVELPPSSALIVVDMQGYFCRTDSSLSRFLRSQMPGLATDYADRLSRVVIPNIATLLDRFRASGAQVIFTEFGSERTDGADLPEWARQFNSHSTAVIGSACVPPITDRSSRVIPELRPQAGELVVPKTTSGPLAGTVMAYTLRRHGINTVAVTGVATDICVLGTARELADANFTAYLVEDATATPLGADAHAAALRVLSPVFASVITAEDLSLEASAPNPAQ